MLQHSGIGDSEILGPLGIDTLIDLKGVGRNLQEQVCVFFCLGDSAGINEEHVDHDRCSLELRHKETVLTQMETALRTR